MDAPLPTWSHAALAYLPPESALPAWWTRAEAAGWPPSTLASVLAMVAPVTRRVYPDPSSDRHELTTHAGTVSEVSPTHIGGTLPAWDPVGETWVDRPWRWAHPTTARVKAGDPETLAACLVRRSRELCAAARGGV